jgi:class 3 adenylate cyclase
MLLCRKLPGRAVIQHLVVGMMAMGMGLAFWSADRRSPTSRALAVAFASLGICILAQALLQSESGVSLRPYAAWVSLTEALAMAAVLEWLLRVRRMLPAAPGMNTRAGDRSLRLGQAVAGLYVILSLAWPELRQQDFLRAIEHHGLGGFLLRPGFWLFAIPVLFLALCGLAGVLLLFQRRPDPAEQIRVLAMALAVPLFLVGLVLPHDIAAITSVIGLLVFLVGGVHYHVLQGERGQFMSRFLSPQVARMVNERGLERAMQENLLEISVVCCDLRGFTAYAESIPSSEVLREYYDAVGEVVGHFGGTIKDYAGDGVLILVGAPLPVEHHARCALEMARQIRRRGQALNAGWSTETHRLGIGIGVATGVVTVGVIGSATRLEYTAVGAAVNLASRLCAEAQDGEILIDRRTVSLAGEDGLEHRPPLSVKGLREPVAHFALRYEPVALPA